MRIQERVSSLSLSPSPARSVIPEKQGGTLYGSEKRSPRGKSEGRVSCGGAVAGQPVVLRTAVNIGGGRVLNLGLTADRFVVGDRRIKSLSPDVAARYRGALAALLSKAASVPGLIVAGYRFP